MIAALTLVAVLAADSNPPQDLLKRGLLALQHGNIAEARGDLEQASRIDPKNPYVWTSLAQAYLKSNQPKLAAAAAETAEKIAPDDPVVNHALAMYYSETGQLAHAAKLDSEIAFYWTKVFLERGDFTQAAEIAQSGLAGHPKDAQLTLAMGVARYGQRRFDDAIAEFLKTIEIDPGIEQPYVFLGKMLDEAGSRLGEITRFYESWANRNPQSAKAKLLLAKALLTANSRDQRAGALLRESIAIDPGDWETHFELGVVLADKHDYSAAAKELERAVELDPKQPMVHYHLARVYDRLGEAQRAQAEREKHEQLTAGSQR